MSRLAPLGLAACVWLSIGCAARTGKDRVGESPVAWPSAHEGHTWLGKELLWFPQPDEGYAIDPRADSSPPSATFAAAASACRSILSP
jgi:hypothetical protein